MKTSEVQQRADFSAIRYAQCWEDAALLVAALEPAGKHCVSIGSAGDNSFALLAHGAESVTAVELNPAQTACIELRRAAYLTLDHAGFLELHGSRPSDRRAALYADCRTLLEPTARTFWDDRPDKIRQGIGSLGKFENYFRLFRQTVLPLAHPRHRVESLLEPRSPSEREAFYRDRWDNRRWRGIFQVFFSRTLMGLLGRDPEFFRYVEGSVAQRILDRTRHALVKLDPSTNPYLHWILTGTHGTHLPDALEERHFALIQAGLHQDRFRIVSQPLEHLLAADTSRCYDAWNLSDIFEYMSEDNTADLLRTIAARSTAGARLAYWNMLAPRSRPETLADVLEPLDDLARRLFEKDRAFFYSRFVVEEVKARA